MPRTQAGPLRVTRTVRVDEEVWRTLQYFGVVFTDTPNNVLRRFLRLNKPVGEVKPLPCLQCGTLTDTRLKTKAGYLPVCRDCYMSGNVPQAPDLLTP